MFSACTSIKVAISLNKVADLSKEHSALSTPSFTFSFFFSGFRAAAVGTCSHCRLVPAKLDNLGEMDKFLETHSLLRLSQEEIGNWNRLITRNEIESVIKLPAHKSLRIDSFIGEFTVHKDGSA